MSRAESCLRRLLRLGGAGIPFSQSSGYDSMLSLPRVQSLVRKIKSHKLLVYWGYPKSDASSNSNLGVQCFGVRGYMNPKPNANPTLSLTLTGTRIWGCGVLGEGMHEL